MFRRLGDKWSYERLHLDTQAHGRRFSLRLDPGEGDGDFTCGYLLHSYLAPHTRYRISVWIRCAQPDGVFASVLGRQIGLGKTTAEWQQFTAEATTQAGGGCLSRVLYNHSREPAWFDDFTVEEVAPAN